MSDTPVVGSIVQLEADLKRHEGKIRYYPDSYLGKIFFQGVECGKKQCEADLNAVCAYADKLEAKLEAIECGECEKSMLHCRCDEESE